jgi:hypothetical protein
MDDLLNLYLFAARSGDRPLAAALARALRSEPRLRSRADDALRRMPRAPARWSAEAARAVSRLASTLS